MHRLTRVCLLIAVQGALGIVQYQLEVPAEMVWVHVALAACVWLALLWATLAAGSLGPRHGAPEPPHEAPAASDPPLVRS